MLEVLAAISIFLPKLFVSQMQSDNMDAYWATEGVSNDVGLKLHTKFNSPSAETH